MEIYFLVYLALINLIAFLCFLLDKRRAMKNQWRIRERTLLLLCLAGGCFGGLLGMLGAHHKTKTAKFVLSVPLLCAVYIGLLFYFFIGKVAI